MNWLRLGFQMRKSGSKKTTRHRSNFDPFRIEGYTASLRTEREARLAP